MDYETLTPCCTNDNCNCPNGNLNLDSVGSWVDQDGLVFADNNDGILNGHGVHIMDVCDEWWESMSMDDVVLLFPFLAEIKELYYSANYLTWATTKFGVVEHSNNEYANFDFAWVNKGVA